MAIDVTARMKVPPSPTRTCRLCGKNPLMVMEDDNTLVCEYCDVGGNKMPPPGGLEKDEEHGE